MRKDATITPLIFPAVVAIDTREQTPFAFQGITADARDARRPIIVETARVGLASGDYSLVGHEAAVAIERKSLADLFSTLASGRKRFQRELDRLAALEFAAVVVEADWRTVYTAPPTRSRLSPKTVIRSVIAWQVRLPRIAWWFCPGREFAERVTFRLLERYWKTRTRITNGSQPRRMGLEGPLHGVGGLDDDAFGQSL